MSFCCCHAEDGIRDTSVTGVQTCALPISCWNTTSAVQDLAAFVGAQDVVFQQVEAAGWRRALLRSEERRVGKQWTAPLAPRGPQTRKRNRRGAASTADKYSAATPTPPHTR